MNDPHAILGISRDASAEEIRRAYRRQAMRHHPDAGGDRRAFAEILSAYERLGGKVSQRDAAARTTSATEGESRPRPPPTDSCPQVSPDPSGRRTRRRGPRRRHRRYSAWRIIPESYSAARFPRRPHQETAPTWLERLVAVAIWIGFLAVICLVMWLILQANFVRRFPPDKQPFPPPQYVPPRYLDLGPDTI